MSLDVRLIRTKWVSYDEGLTHEIEEETLYSSNITHNLGEMAEKAGIYEALWRPYQLKPDYVPVDYQIDYFFEVNSTTYAKDIIELLEQGLKKLVENPEYYKTFNASNGWGLYEHFVPFVEEYLSACKIYPNSIVIVSR